jgi:Na+/H+ antiporter NhaD/arsenite permease-like protein
VPAIMMSLAINNDKPQISTEQVLMKRGAKRIIILFFLTILTAISFHNFLHLPPFLGMITGLAYLKFFGYYLKKTHIVLAKDVPNYGQVGDVAAFDSYREVARAEWDTLLFFFGVIMCVGGLGFIGYLTQLSNYLYIELGPTIANILVVFFPPS